LKNYDKKFLFYVLSIIIPRAETIDNTGINGVSVLINILITCFWHGDWIYILEIQKQFINQSIKSSL
jgi:uncharacterized membrane protein YqaE (UPF0057 family)